MNLKMILNNNSTVSYSHLSETNSVVSSRSEKTWNRTLSIACFRQNLHCLDCYESRGITARQSESAKNKKIAVSS